MKFADSWASWFARYDEAHDKEQPNLSTHGINVFNSGQVMSADAHLPGTPQEKQETHGDRQRPVDSVWHQVDTPGATKDDGLKDDDLHPNHRNYASGHTEYYTLGYFHDAENADPLYEGVSATVDDSPMGPQANSRGGCVDVQLTEGDSLVTLDVSQYEYSLLKEQYLKLDRMYDATGSWGERGKVDDDQIDDMVDALEGHMPDAQMVALFANGEGDAPAIVRTAKNQLAGERRSPNDSPDSADFVFIGGDGNVVVNTVDPAEFKNGTNDQVQLSDGDAVVATGRGEDVVLGGQGDDFVDLGSGNDEYISNGGRDVIIGGSGNDSAILSGGEAYIEGVETLVLTGSQADWAPVRDSSGSITGLVHFTDRGEAQVTKIAGGLKTIKYAGSGLHVTRSDHYTREEWQEHYEGRSQEDADLSLEQFIMKEVFYHPDTQEDIRESWERGPDRTDLTYTDYVRLNKDGFYNNYDAEDFIGDEEADWSVGYSEILDTRWAQEKTEDYYEWHSNQIDGGNDAGKQLELIGGFGINAGVGTKPMWGWQDSGVSPQLDPSIEDGRDPEFGETPTDWGVQHEHSHISMEVETYSYGHISGEGFGLGTDTEVQLFGLREKTTIYTDGGHSISFEKTKATEADAYAELYAGSDGLALGAELSYGVQKSKFKQQVNFNPDGASKGEVNGYISVESTQAVGKKYDPLPVSGGLQISWSNGIQINAFAKASWPLLGSKKIGGGIYIPTADSVSKEAMAATTDAAMHAAVHKKHADAVNYSTYFEETFDAWKADGSGLKSASALQKLDLLSGPFIPQQVDDVIVKGTAKTYNGMFGNAKKLEWHKYDDKIPDSTELFEKIILPVDAPNHPSIEDVFGKKSGFFKVDRFWGHDEEVPDFVPRVQVGQFRDFEAYEGAVPGEYYLNSDGLLTSRETIRQSHDGFISVSDFTKDLSGVFETVRHIAHYYGKHTGYNQRYMDNLEYNAGGQARWRGEALGDDGVFHHIHDHYYKDRSAFYGLQAGYEYSTDGGETWQMGRGKGVSYSENGGHAWYTGREGDVGFYLDHGFYGQDDVLVRSAVWAPSGKVYDPYVFRSNDINATQQFVTGDPWREVSHGENLLLGDGITAIVRGRLTNFKAETVSVDFGGADYLYVNTFAPQELRIEHVSAESEAAKSWKEVAFVEHGTGKILEPVDDDLPFWMTNRAHLANEGVSLSTAAEDAIYASANRASSLRDPVPDRLMTIKDVEAGATVQITDDYGKTWYNLVEDAEYDQYSFTLPGEHYGPEQIGVRQLHVSKRSGEAEWKSSDAVFYSESFGWDYDLPEPPDTFAAPPVVTLARDTGHSDDDGITQDNAIVISGLEGSDAQVELRISGGEPIDLGSPGDGRSIRYELPQGHFAPGEIEVRQMDAAGNVSAWGINTSPITIDTSAPRLSLPAFDQDISSQSRVEIDGTDALSAGDRWYYTLDGGQNWQEGTGASSFDLPDAVYGPGDIGVRGEDLAGNIAEVWTTRFVEIDTVAKRPELRLDRNAQSVNEQLVTPDGVIAVEGLEAGATGYFSLDGGVTWSVLSDGSFQLPEGAYDAGMVQVKQVDRAGNASEVSVYKDALVVDRGTTPVELSVSGMVRAGLSASGEVEVAALERGARFEYTLDGGQTWISGDGTTFVLPDGDFGSGEVGARQIDAVGHVGAPVYLQALRVDTYASAPELSLSVVEGANGALVSQGGVEVLGLEPGASWEYTLNAQAPQPVWHEGRGRGFDLPEGALSASDIAVRQTDLAGHTSEARGLASALEGTGDELIVDRHVAAFNAEQVTDTGTDGDNISASSTIALRGVEDGAQLWVRYSAQDDWTALAEGARSFDLPEGIYDWGDVRVRQVDLVGNVAEIALDRLEIDTTAAAAPRFQMRYDSGRSQTDGVSQAGIFDVLDIEDGARWEYTLSGPNAAAADWITGQGRQFRLDEGTYHAGQVGVRQIDVAGNVSEAYFNASDLVIDRTADPFGAHLAADTSYAGLVGGDADWLSSDGRVILDGVEPGSHVFYRTSSSGDWERIEASADGTYAFTLQAGHYDRGAVSVLQVDQAGNEFVRELPSVTIDQTVATPELSLSDEAAYVDDAGDLVIGQSQITVHGLEAGGRWAYTLAGAAAGPEQWIEGEGRHIQLPGGDGATYSAGDIRVRQWDRAGNESAEVSLDRGLRIDQSVSRLSLRLEEDLGAFSDDWVSARGTVLVEGAESGSTLYVHEAYSPGLSVDDAGWRAIPQARFTLEEGVYEPGQIAVRQVDKLGNEQIQILDQRVEIDTTAPEALIEETSLFLQHDSWAEGDGVTDTGTILVDGLPADRVWAYSTDGGAHWVERFDGNQFELSTGVYVAGMVQVRHQDLAGNWSDARSLDREIEVVEGEVVSPEVMLSEDTGREGDRITSNGRVRVELPEQGGAAAWRWSDDGGVSWAYEMSSGADAGFTLADGAYDEGQVRVAVYDSVRRAWGDTQLDAVEVDSTIAVPTLTLSDGWTQDASGTSLTTGKRDVIVSGLEAGAQWEYSLDGGQSWSAGTGESFRMTGDHGTRFEAGDLQVRQRDTAGNESAVGRVEAAVELDLAVDPFDLDLAVDTGHADDAASYGDAISASGVVNVQGVEDGAELYLYVGYDDTVDADAAGWVRLAGPRFELDPGHYPAGSVAVKQIDRHGNMGLQTFDAVTIDATAPETLDLALSADTAPVAPGATDALSTDARRKDGVTSAQELIISGFEDGARWEYSLSPVDAQEPVWQRGMGTRIHLGEDGAEYAAGQIRVRQYDGAGNISAETASTQRIVVDRSVDDGLSATLAKDTGLWGQAWAWSGSDGVTTVGEVILTGMEEGSDLYLHRAYDTGVGLDDPNWERLTDARFTLAAGVYEAGDLAVLQIDAAGNRRVETLDRIEVLDPDGLSAPELSLSLDTGLSTDGITYAPEVTVAGLKDVAYWVYTVTGLQDNPEWRRGSGDRFELPEDGDYAAGAIRVRVYDTAGRQAETTLGQDVTLLRDVGTIEAGLVEDPAETSASGLMPTSGRTGSREVEVYGLDLGQDPLAAGFEYTLNGNSTAPEWIRGTGAHFELAAPEAGQTERHYAAGDIQVRAVSAAGLRGDAFEMGPVILDEGIDPVSFTLEGALEDSAGRQVSSSEVILLDGLEAGSRWEYTLNADAADPADIVWRQPADDTAAIRLTEDGVYAAGSIGVRQWDVAGNYAELYTTQTLVLDRVAEAVAAAPSGVTERGETANAWIAAPVEALEDGARWEVTTDGGVSWHDWTTATELDTIKSAGVDGFELVDGTYGSGQVGLRQVDAYDNISKPSFLERLTVDTVALAPRLMLPQNAMFSEAATTSMLGLSASRMADSSDGNRTTVGSTYDDAGTPAASTGSMVMGLGDTTATPLDRDQSGGAEPESSPAGEYLTNAAQLEISGLEQGASWWYTFDGNRADAVWLEGEGDTIAFASGQVTEIAAGALGLKQADRLGNLSDAQFFEDSIVVDRQAPNRINARLFSDTGISSTDRITRSSRIEVSGVEANASWEYSTDHGRSWTTGAGMAFYVNEGVYWDGQVQVRQTDAAGNTGAAQRLEGFEVDQTADPLRITARGGRRDGGDTTTWYSNTGEFEVQGVEAGAQWYYWTEGWKGNRWESGHWTQGRNHQTFGLEDGEYFGISAYQIDVAGNRSNVGRGGTGISDDGTRWSWYGSYGGGNAIVDTKNPEGHLEIFWDPLRGYRDTQFAVRGIDEPFWEYKIVRHSEDEGNWIRRETQHEARLALETFQVPVPDEPTLFSLGGWPGGDRNEPLHASGHGLPPRHDRYRGYDHQYDKDGYIGNVYGPSYKHDPDVFGILVREVDVAGNAGRIYTLDKTVEVDGMFDRNRDGEYDRTVAAKHEDVGYGLIQNGLIQNGPYSQVPDWDQTAPWGDIYRGTSYEVGAFEDPYPGLNSPI